MPNMLNSRKNLILQPLPCYASSKSLSNHRPSSLNHAAYPLQNTTKMIPIVRRLCSRGVNHRKRIASSSGRGSCQPKQLPKHRRLSGKTEYDDDMSGGWGRWTSFIGETKMTEGQGIRTIGRCWYGWSTSQLTHIPHLFDAMPFDPILIVCDELCEHRGQKFHNKNRRSTCTS